jgi:hypothetical protein
VFVDLVRQVKNRLPINRGGTGNRRGYSVAVVKPCYNRTGATLALGAVVKLSHTWDDPRVTPCDITEDTNVLGVVVGYYENDDGSTLVEAAAVTGHSVAVMIYGTCNVLLGSAATRGQYAYVDATDGTGKGIAGTPTPGAFGVFEQSGTAGNLARCALGAPLSNVGLAQYGGVDIIIDGGGAVITTGVKVDLETKYAGTIASWTLLADQSGSIVIDLWKDTYANFAPTVADTITAAAKPTLAAAIKNQSSTLTGWTTSFARGDIIRVNVDSVGTVTRVVLGLTFQRT